MKNPATLLTLVSAALALGLAGLLPAVVCLLVMLLVGLVGVFVPAWFPQVTAVSWRRTTVAGGALGLVVLATALTGPRSLITGDVDDPLASAAAVLAVPSGVPLGLLAALAAGSLVAVTLELGDRRGVQSGLVLGAAVLGLACVAAPSGQRLLVPIVVGWPAALFALTKLTTVQARQASAVTGLTVTHPTDAHHETALAPAFRWRVLPVLLAIALSCGLLGAAAASGLAEIAENAATASGSNAGTVNGARSWDNKFLGGRMNLNSRGPLSENPIAEVPADAPTHWRTATLDYYNGEGWQVTGSPGLTTTITSSGGGVLLRTEGEDSAEGTGGSGDAGESGDAGSAGESGDTGDAAGSGDLNDPDGVDDSGTGDPDPGTQTAVPSSPPIAPSPANPDDDLSNPADPGNLGIGDSGDGTDSGTDGGQDSLETPGATTPVPTRTASRFLGATLESLETPTERSSIEATPSTTPSPLQSGTVRTDDVRIRGNGTAQLIAPGRVITADLPVSYAERTFVSAGDRVLMPSQNNDEYSVTSRVYPDTSAQASLGSAGDDEVAGSSASPIDSRWLQVPDALPDRVRALGQELVATAPDRLTAVRAVEVRLARMMTYTLNAEIPPEGRDAVDFALFDSGEGYCEHYASAEVMLLRSAGVPARMVVGYLADGSDSTDAGRQVIRQAQAHAWVEVWFPGAGWVTSDPTPAGGIEQDFLQSVNSAFNRAMSSIAEHTVAFVTGVVGPVVLVAVLLVLWLFRRFLLGRFGRLFARFGGRGPETSGAGEHRLDPDLRNSFARLESALAAQGAGRAPSETLATLRARVVGARVYTELEETADLEKAFDVLTRALYAPEPPGRDECLSATETFDREAERQVRLAKEGQPVASLGQSAQLM